MKERQEERRGVHTSRWQPKRVTTHRAAKMQRLPYDLPSGDPRSALHPLRRTQYISRDKRSARGRGRGERWNLLHVLLSTAAAQRPDALLSFLPSPSANNKVWYNLLKRPLGTHLGHAAQSNDGASECDLFRLSRSTNHACRSRHRQKVTLHRKKPLKLAVTNCRGQLDFPDHASVHLEPPGYYIPLWGNKRMTPQFFSLNSR